ncbi:DUF72 domain-containing protein [Flavobacterium sp. MXW15]|uniref:DUF72 domain-containing protein n=1 Tax=Xanthomonas chitinilytica TaxID=2989819 RepID=A0ABT3JRD9_9XANT|nr:DUF72 domain-containing protein [Xanthomonas sp. H13-6]MCW4453918.1 DUF72 domain-containing protein [Flavobacterium sp. MXW15]MCW4471036.1 DUF72 domain-containing protein [Xanthomonas sp. H13-6]
MPDLNSAVDSLPYRLGCPSWNEPAWRGGFYPAGLRPADSLGHYVQVFNAVEGNTTFHARPAPATVQRWAGTMPEGFRFCAKLPRDISHEGDLRERVDATEAFLDLLAPLGTRLAPLWLQLPAGFGPERLGELSAWLDRFAARELAVEVRHPAFFARGEEERALNRLLHARGVERICLDSRALFACAADDPAVAHAQAKKPRLPVRAAAFSRSPQVRFIGGPDLDANQAWLEPWRDKVVAWIEEGRTPHVFLHTPDNRLAAEQALRFHALLRARLPGLPELRAPLPAAVQPDLF